MAFAVIETGGKQYRVSDGTPLTIEKLPGTLKDGEKIVFDKVLLLDDGTTTTVGKPYIEGAKIEATFEGNGRNRKIVVIKFKQKSRYFKKRGHKQPHSKVKIASVK